MPLAILSASFLGSWHCVGMCGGLVTAVSKSKRDLLHYHLSRLLGYMSVGAISGLIGTYVFIGHHQWIQWVTSLFMTIFFIGLGISLIRGNATIIHINIPIVTKLCQALFRTGNKKQHLAPILIGFSSVLLPCGWLYAFVLMAMQSRDVLIGSLILATFWLGTLPALTASPMMLNMILNPLKTWGRTITGLILIGLGLATIAYRMIYPLMTIHH